MEGELTSDSSSKHAGVIPRSIHTIFDVLENQSLEYSVKVSFLELYNEELTDLLAEDEGGPGGEGVKELRIFEDTTGKRGMLVNNLEEDGRDSTQQELVTLSLRVHHHGAH
jgi:kinesin family protein 11